MSCSALPHGAERAGVVRWAGEAELRASRAAELRQTALLGAGHLRERERWGCAAQAACRLALSFLKCVGSLGLKTFELCQQNEQSAGWS